MICGECEAGGRVILENNTHGDRLLIVFISERQRSKGVVCAKTNTKQTKTKQTKYNTKLSFCSSAVITVVCYGAAVLCLKLKLCLV